MFSLRCLRTALEASTKFSATAIAATRSTQTRSFGVLSSLPTRPRTLPARAGPPATEVQSTTLQPTSQPGLSILQVRGAKRDTYNPSHVVRKRRHGFLSRLRTRTGRRTLLRRKMKNRNTLSH